MDTALRNRLTGAALLILLAVILLPEMLTGEGGDRASTSETAAGTDQPVQSYNFDLNEPVDVPTPPLDEPVATPAPILPQPAAVAAATPATAPTPAPATPTSTPSAAPAVAVVPKAEPAKPEPAKAEPPKPAPKSSAASDAGYFVQIGVFSNKASADRLARELRKKKFSVVVKQLEGPKPLHRVRVGPAADRKAAEALAKRLAAAGHKGSVVSAS